VLAGRDEAWAAYEDPIRAEAQTVLELLNAAAAAASEGTRPRVEALRDELKRKKDPLRRDIAVAARRALAAVRAEGDAVAGPLAAWLAEQKPIN